MATIVLKKTQKAYEVTENELQVILANPDTRALYDFPENSPLTEGPVLPLLGDTWNVILNAKYFLSLDADKSIGVISKSGSEGSLLVTGKGHSITFEEADFIATLQTKAEGDTLICYANYAGKREVWVDNAEGVGTTAAAPDFVSIVDFGAVPSPAAHGGTQEVPTDCTDAIQSALDSGAKRVFVPAGRFLITTTLQIPEGVELFGEITEEDESEIFCNESWTGGDMLALANNTTLRKLFVNGAGYCEYNINPGRSNNVLIKECSAADSTMAEISFYGQGLIEGGNYDRPPNENGRNGASFELGGQVKVKDLSLNLLNISGGDGSAQEAYAVNTRTLYVSNNARLMFWGGSVTQEVVAGSNSFAYGRFFGTKFGFNVGYVAVLGGIAGVGLIGCVEE